MCGIGGIYRVEKNQKIKSQNMDKLFKAIESRGKDACGAAWTWKDSDNKIVVFKEPTKSSILVNRGFTKKFVGELINFVLFHTRYATKGTIKNNKNNHPIVSENIVMTHNGWFVNDEEVWKTLETQRTAKVDSEAMAASIHEKGIQWAFDELEGPASIAWVDTKDASKVHLLTNGQNPLVIGRLKNGNVIWASKSEHLRELPVRALWEAKPYRIYTLNPDGKITKTDIDEPISEETLQSNYYSWHDWADFEDYSGKQ